MSVRSVVAAGLALGCARARQACELLLIPLGVVLSLHAQQPVFRAGVDYVELDVVVTDKNDNAIKDLTAADFEILERRRPQKLVNFQFMSIPPTRRVVTDVKSVVPTVDVVTNTHAPTGRQWVLVIDDLHIIEQHIVHTKKVVQEFLEQLPVEDQVAIVFVGRSDLSQGFTSDLGAQMRTVNRICESLGFAYDAADVGGGSAVPRVAQADRHTYGMASIDVLNNISASLARSTYPRKALVYVSEGMTYSLEQTLARAFSLEAVYATDFFDGLRRAFEVARKAGVPVYPIDPRGLPDCSFVRGDCDRPPMANIRTQWNNMRSLAENTGGLAFVGNSDIPRAVRELVEDNSSYYILGYYPQPFERDGKFHDVKVTVKRPGVRVRARAGYNAPKASVVATVAETKQALNDALGAALPESGLSLRAFAAPVAVSARGMTTVVTVEVSYPQPLDGSRIVDDLQFGLLALDHDGKQKVSVRRAFHVTATPKGTADVTYLINDTIDLPAQPLALRVAVASQRLGKAGTIHVPVEVINASDDKVQISGVVLGFSGALRQTAVPPGALKDLVPFQPTTARTFAASDTLQIFAPLFWASKDASASVTMAIRRGDEVVTERVEQVAAVPSQTSHRRAQFKTTVPLKTLAPGSYLLELTANLPKGAVSRRDIAFEVRQ